MKQTHLLFIFFAFFLYNITADQVHAADIPDPVGHIYVQDFAKILSDQEKSELVELASYLDDKTGAQLAVLIIPSLNNNPVEQYALEAFRKYELGDKEKNNGVLLLLATEDRKIYIEVGYGLEGRLPDGKVGRILDTYALPYLEEGDVSSAVDNTYRQLFNEIAEEYNLGKQVDTQSFEYGYEQGPSIVTIIIITLIFLGIVFLDFRFFGGALSLSLLRILTIASRSRGGGGGPRGGGGGSAGGGGAGRSW